MNVYPGERMSVDLSPVSYSDSYSDSLIVGEFEYNMRLKLKQERSGYFICFLWFLLRTQYQADTSLLQYL